MTFPSAAWLDAFVAELNAHPGLRAALAGLEATLGAVVEADPPALRESFAAFGEQRDGRIGRPRVLADPDDLDELEPAYLVRAPYRVWKALLRGEDPVRAALSGRVRVEGDLESLVRRAHHRHIVDAALARLATAFADEGGGPR